MTNHVKDLSLAASGERRLAWAERDMPVLAGIREEYKKTKPFKRQKNFCLYARYG